MDVTWPLHGRYIWRVEPRHHRYHSVGAVTWPLHDRYLRRVEPRHHREHHVGDAAGRGALKEGHLQMAVEGQVEPRMAGERRAMPATRLLRACCMPAACLLHACCMPAACLLHACCVPATCLLRACLPACLLRAYMTVISRHLADERCVDQGGDALTQPRREHPHKVALLERHLARL